MGLHGAHRGLDPLLGGGDVIDAGGGLHGLFTRAGGVVDGGAGPFGGGGGGGFEGLLVRKQLAVLLLEQRVVRREFLEADRGFL